ncbi:MAG: hypothetical protein JXR31_13155 [Prolixibacteraceae bacterium]|nr:hypothetical protein [Prolixibacteraceae bacterium]MBN2775197.1 hypothetical protein [Prolixibacteraceae bacterium]
MKPIVFLAMFISMLLIQPVFSQNKSLLNLKWEQNYTPTYDEVIEMYQLLDKNYKNATLLEKGKTDTGKPLHLFVINNKEEFDPVKIKSSGKSILLINNGIHPGEPAGIDASLWFADDILRNKDGLSKILDNTVIIIIPVYSIGGHLNRSAYNRSGQTTPYETGFRGNAKNLDLNRDFTKCDSENAKSFSKIFMEWDPDMFLDTHTTNGSDHQYSITLIPPEPDLFPPIMENFIREKFIPEIYSKMEQGEYDLIPYVSFMFRDPKLGINMTQEGPRYSSGFASMFHSYGMMTESHIYKPYPDRVKSCYQFIVSLAEFTSENSKKIIESRKKGIQESINMDVCPIAYELDTSKYQMIEFKGYETDNEQVSPLNGLKRFGYDRSKPYAEKIKYFDTWDPSEMAQVPEYYILPQGYTDVIERLELAGVKYDRLEKDTIIKVTVDYIDEFSTSQQPGNGHYFHNKVSTHSNVQDIQYYKDDLVIPVRQEKIRYLIEMLEPKARDSFFRWNFFDNILDQREYFSPYGFEENAIKYLEEHPEFKKEFEGKRKSDSDFANNHRAQMSYIYNNSEWFEKTWKRYPVGKIF